MRTESIYIISTKDSADQEYIKIGITSGSPSDRIKGLQTGCPIPLTLKRFFKVPSIDYGYRKGGSSGGRIEKALHSSIEAYHVSGEWFKMDNSAWALLNASLEPIAKYESDVIVNDSRQRIEALLNEAVKNV